MGSQTMHEQERDLERNTAFFLGAFGAVLGVFGAGMSMLGIVAWLLPGFARTAPDWFFMLVVVGLLGLVVGVWPALDWLANHHVRIGGLAMAVLGLAVIAVGLAAALWTPWGPTGWMAVAGGLTLLPAAYLALVGRGTEPLTWRSLHRRSHLASVDTPDARRVP